MTSKSVVGVCLRQDEAWNLVNLLKRAGIRNSGINVYYPTHLSQPLGLPSGQKTLATKGAMIGGGIGFGIGVVLSLLAGLSFIPAEVSSLYPAQLQWLGPLALVFLGAIYGAGAGALIGIGTPESAPRRFYQYLKDGGIILEVTSRNPDKLTVATEILTKNGAEDVTHINDDHAIENAIDGETDVSGIGTRNSNGRHELFK